MKRSWALPMVALAAAAFTGYHLVITNREPPMEPPPVAPATSPFGRTVAGAGIVEAKTENISIGTHLPGIVAQRLVDVGQKVDVGTPLFRIDDRQLRADLEVRKSQLAAAEAQLAKLRAMPRPEEIPASEARVRKLQADLAAVRDQLDRAEKLYSSRSIPREELTQRREQATAALEALNQAQAEDRLLKQGAWDKDILIAEAEIAQATAVVAQIETEIERLEVRSPIAGEVLQVNVRPGEYVGTPPGAALIVLGDMRNLRVRVDVDESDIPRYRPGMSGQASVRGNASRQIPLRFVRVEPFVIPKQSLTRKPGEQVDTRVLQVIYEMDENQPGVYVGQQLDVFFLEESAGSETASVAAQEKIPAGR